MYFCFFSFPVVDFSGEDLYRFEFNEQKCCRLFLDLLRDWFLDRLIELIFHSNKMKRIEKNNNKRIVVRFIWLDAKNASLDCTGFHQRLAIHFSKSVRLPFYLWFTKPAYFKIDLWISLHAMYYWCATNVCIEKATNYHRIQFTIICWNTVKLGNCDMWNKWLSMWLEIWGHSSTHPSIFKLNYSIEHPANDVITYLHKMKWSGITQMKFWHCFCLFAPNFISLIINQNNKKQQNLKKSSINCSKTTNTYVVACTIRCW